MAVLTVTNVVISNNGTATSGAGIGLFPTSTGSVNATLTNVSMVNNPRTGLHVTGNSNVMVVDSNIANNASFGILTAAPGSPTLRVANTTITGSGTGIGNGGGSILTYGNNRLNGNTTDGAFSGTVDLQ